MAVTKKQHACLGGAVFYEVKLRSFGLLAILGSRLKECYYSFLQQPDKSLRGLGKRNVFHDDGP